MAQAANPADAGGGDAPQSALQNPKVQIAVVAVVAVILIAVIAFVFMGGGGGGDSGGTTPNPAAGDAGAYPAGPGTPAAAPGAAPGAAPAAAPAGLPGAMPAPGAAPGGDGRTAQAPPAGAGTANPFRQNRDLAEVLRSVPKNEPFAPPPTIAPELEVYKELYKPKPVTTVSQDENEGPPIPAMRVAGVIFGQTAGPSATIQIGDQYMQVTPGKMVPNDNPVFRVERIEQEKVILTRRWELGGRKGVQRIEVTLAGSSARPGGFGAPGAGGNGPGGNAPLF